MKHLNFTRGPYSLTTNPRRFDIDAVHGSLSRTGKSWARGIPKTLVAKSIAHSLCFGLFHGKKQIGFARIVTDYSTYAYLCDVYVLKKYQGRGLGKWMIEKVVGHPELQGLRRVSPGARRAGRPFK